VEVKETAHKGKLLVLVGPTAVGKTKLSIELAKQYGCEIISGDSMQVYRGMDIGTAKATAEQMSEIPHHLIDIRNPDEPFSVSDFQRLAQETIDRIQRRNKLPFIVGGTGLYIQSVCYDYAFTEGGADEKFRRDMHEYADRNGAEALLQKLHEVDPVTALRLHANDRRRIIRALEIAKITGITLSEQLAKQNRQSPYNLCIIGLSMDRALLYERIEMRIDVMLEQGLVAEVRGLLEAGYEETLTAMQGLGYKEIAAYILGRSSLEEAVLLLKQNTRRFAKRQLSWFRRMAHIDWVDVTESENISKHLRSINDIIEGKFKVNTEYTWKQC